MPQPGAPFPFGRQIPESVIKEFGDLEEGDGAKLSLKGDQLIFKCSANGAEVLIAVSVTELLAEIEAYGNKHES